MDPNFLFFVTFNQRSHTALLHCRSSKSVAKHKRMYACVSELEENKQEGGLHETAPEAQW